MRDEELYRRVMELERRVDDSPMPEIIVTTPSGEIPLSNLADYARGSVIRGGAVDWEAYDVKIDGAAIVGDGTDVLSDLTPLWKGEHNFQAGIQFSGATTVNIVEIPDNIADAASIEDGGGLEYLRAVTTNANPYLLLLPVNDSGNVGIGTLAPVASLSVRRGANSESISAGLTGSWAARVADTSSVADHNGLVVTTSRNFADNWSFAAGFQNAVTGAYTDYFKIKGDGSVHIATLTAGYVKSSAAGALSVATEVPLVDVGGWAEGSLTIGGAADWETLVEPGAAGYALVSDGTTFEWDQTPEWTGDHTWLSSASAHPALTIENTNADGQCPVIEFYKNSVSPANNDDLGAYDFYGETSTGAKDRYAYWLAESLDITNGATGGGMRFMVTMNGTDRFLLDISGFNGVANQGEVIVNESGQDVDFRVEAIGVVDAIEVQGSDGQITLGVLTAGYVKSSAGGVLSVATEVPLIDLGSYTQGDLIYGGAADWQDLAHPGVANRVLQSSAAEVVWSANAVTFPTAGAVPVGSGANTRLAIWSAANTLTSNANLTYDGSILEIGGKFVGGDLATSTATNTNAFAWGLNNDATGTYSLAAGGFGHLASGHGAVVLGGFGCNATGQGSTICGGHDDNVSGQQSIALGGFNVDLSGDYSLGAGYRAKDGGFDGVFIWADYTAADFTADHANQVAFRCGGGFKIVQHSATTAVPVLLLSQADVSEEMIEFACTIGVGNAIEAVGGKTLTTTHFIKVTLPGGLTRYIPVGTIA